MTGRDAPFPDGPASEGSALDGPALDGPALDGPALDGAGPRAIGPDGAGSPAGGPARRPLPPAPRPAIVDVTDGRMAALRNAAAAGSPVRWSPSGQPVGSAAPRQGDEVTVGAASSRSATAGGAGAAAPGPGPGAASDDGTIELGELSGPGRTTLTITGLERREGAATRPARPVLTRVLPLVVIDLAALAAGWGLSGTAAAALRIVWPAMLDGAGLDGAGLGEAGFDGAGLLAMVAAFPAWCGLIGAAGGYRGAPAGWPSVRVVLDAVARFAAGGCLLLLLTAPDVARRFAVVVPVAAVVTLGLRALARLVLPAGPRQPVRVLLVGDADAVERAARRVARTGAGGPRPVGAGSGTSGVRVVGRCVTGRAGGDGLEADDAADDVLRRRLTATARATGAELVLLANTAGFSAPSLRRLAWTLHASGVGLVLAAGPSGVAANRLRVQPIVDLPVLHIDPPAFTGVRRVLKSVVDRCGALVLIVLLAPVMLAVAGTVRASGAGPVIFRQQRVGRHGERFVMLKFRSMSADAPALRARLEARSDHRRGVLFKMRSDPRVTGVGRVLRRLSLDELPQLVNVLRGEMSLVGPRPALPSEVERYEPDVLRRLLVKPGLTGLWQVSGRADLDWAETVRLDLGYVENWSLALDARILLRTVRAVVRGQGAR